MVQPKNRVQVDRSAVLVFDHLDERQPRLSSPRLDAQPSMTGELASYSDNRAVPQRGGVHVPKNRRGVVEAVSTQRLSQHSVVRGMPRATAPGDAVLTSPMTPGPAE